MIKVLAEQVTIKVGKKWIEVKAILTSTKGGKRVVYVDHEGNEVHTEPFSHSRFKDIDLD